MLIMAYGGIWGIGILGLSVFYSRLQRHLSNLKLAEEQIKHYTAELESKNQVLEELNY